MYVYIPTTLKINHSNHKINRYILSSTHRIHTRDATPLQRVFARLILLQPPFQILQFLQRHSLKKKKRRITIKEKVKINRTKRRIEMAKSDWYLVSVQPVN